MKDEAETHASDDKTRRELVDTKNQAEQMAYQVEKTVKENEAKIDDELKTEIEAKVKTVREKAEGEDAAAIQAAISELEQAMHKASEKLYQQPPDPAEGDAGQPAGEDAETADAGAGAGDEEIKDAEFEVK